MYISAYIQPARKMRRKSTKKIPYTQVQNACHAFFLPFCHVRHKNTPACKKTCICPKNIVPLQPQRCFYYG